jgi:plasmid stabilization system protein ParE
MGFGTILIARDSAEAADRVLDELNEQFALLGRFPEIGELQPLLADGTYRRFVHRKSVIYYRPIDDGIVIMRVFHRAQDHEPQA